jgi:DNA invertase Pin-like site-specific DNA recombinase
MTPIELRDTIEDYRDAVKNNAVCLEVFLRTGERAALKRFAKARRKENQLLQIVLGDDHAATVVKPTHGRRRLDDEQIEDVKRRLDHGEALNAVAKTFGVSAHTVRRMVDSIGNEANG